MPVSTRPTPPSQLRPFRAESEGGRGVSGYGGMNDGNLPRRRAGLAQFQPYRTQMLKADVRINANEWPEPNVAGRYITPEELNGVLLNRYPGRGDELREILSARWGTQPHPLILANRSNELLPQAFLVFRC